MKLGPEQLAAAQQRLALTWKTLSEAPTNPIAPIEYKDLTYDHNERGLQIAQRGLATIEVSYAPALFHFFLHQDEVISHWELGAVRGLAPTSSDSSNAKMTVFRLRIAMFDFRAPYKYIQTVRSSRLDSPDYLYSPGGYVLPKVD